MNVIPHRVDDRQRYVSNERRRRSECRARRSGWTWSIGLNWNKGATRGRCRMACCGDNRA